MHRGGGNTGAGFRPQKKGVNQESLKTSPVNPSSQQTTKLSQVHALRALMDINPSLAHRIAHHLGGTVDISADSHVTNSQWDSHVGDSSSSLWRNSDGDMNHGDMRHGTMRHGGEGDGETFANEVAAEIIDIMTDNLQDAKSKKKNVVVKKMRAQLTQQLDIFRRLIISPLNWKLVYIYVCVCVCTHIYVYAHTLQGVCMTTCTHFYMYVYICLHIHCVAWSP